jgi:hypothetical protein
MFKSHLFPCFLFSLFVSCTFEPSGEIFKEVKKNDYSDVSINLNTSGSSLYVFGDVTFNYEIKPSGVKIYEVQLVLNDVIVDKILGAPEKGAFRFKSYLYPSGIHSLTIRAVVSTGTGSLADRVGAEGLLLWRSFELTIDNSPASQVDFIKLDTTGGRMILYWEPIENRNFQSYEIVKHLSRPSQKKELIIITDKTINSWEDLDFVAGEVSYMINVRAGTQLTEGTVRRFSWIPSSKYSWTNQKLVFSWESPRFRSNTKSFERINDGKTTTINFYDTIYQLSEGLKLGTPYSNDIKYLSVDNNHSFLVEQKGYIGQQILGSTLPNAFHNATRTYYSLNSPSQESVVFDRFFQSLIRVSDHLIRGISSSGFNFFQVEHVFDVDANSIVSEFRGVDPLTLDPFGRSIKVAGRVEMFSVSDNGLIVYSTEFGVFVLDVNSSVVFPLPESNGSSVGISPNGTFLTDGRKVYKFQSGTLTDFLSFNSEGFVSAIFVSENILVVSYIDRVERIDIANGIHTTIFNSSSGILRMHFDPIVNKLLVTDYEYNAYLIDTNSGLAKHVATRFEGTLLNGQLLSKNSNGFIIIDSIFF